MSFKEENNYAFSKTEAVKSPLPVAVASRTLGIVFVFGSRWT
jgi:hypothetical protein